MSAQGPEAEQDLPALPAAAPAAPLQPGLPRAGHLHWHTRPGQVGEDLHSTAHRLGGFRGALVD